MPFHNGQNFGIWYSIIYQINLVKFYANFLIILVILLDSSILQFSVKKNFHRSHLNIKLIRLTFNLTRKKKKHWSSKKVVVRLAGIGGRIFCLVRQHWAVYKFFSVVQWQNDKNYVCTFLGNSRRSLIVSCLWGTVQALFILRALIQNDLC